MKAIVYSIRTNEFKFKQVQSVSWRTLREPVPGIDLSRKLPTNMDEIHDSYLGTSIQS